MYPTTREAVGRCAVGVKAVRSSNSVETEVLGSSRRGDPRVVRALESTGLKFEIDEDGDFKILVEFKDGRSQLGFINSSTERYGSLEIREIWSTAAVGKGSLSEDMANLLLIKNNQVKFRVWRLRETQGGKIAVIFAAHVSADTDGESLRSVVELVFGEADALEEKVNGDDDF